LSACYEDVLRRIRCSVADNKIWVSIDKTTYIDSRYVANAIGTLFAEHPGEVFLVVSEVLDIANYSMIAFLFDNAMKLLWPDEVGREIILLFLTDAALYMVKAVNGLKMYRKVVHVTCLAHTLHRVGHEIRGSYPVVDKLISNVKKVFIKAPLRVQQFKQEAPSLPLPPHPVLTHWGMWLDAALYYCENCTAIEDIFKGFDSSELSSIRVVKELFSHSLSGNMAYIKLNFGAISSTITHLEAVGAQLRNTLEVCRAPSVRASTWQGGRQSEVET
jgi:hypothetical protein